MSPTHSTRTIRLALIGSAFMLGLVSISALAQTVRVGVIQSMSGPFATVGRQLDAGMRLYTKLHADKLPPGVNVELVLRDDGGPNPERVRQLTQELILRDKVQILTGMTLTVNTVAMLPIATEAKVPVLIMNAPASNLTTLSPYVARFSFTLWQTTLPLAQWASKQSKRAHLLLVDNIVGQDAEAAFERGFAVGGGQIVSRVRTPLVNPDFTPFMQRIKDDRPELLFAFVPSGVQATQVMKTYRDLGMDKAGIRFIAPGDLTSDDDLPNMGDTPLGMTTAFHYSTAADRPANRAFLAAWRKEYGEKSIPNFQAVAAWDTMDAIFSAVRAQGGQLDAERTMALIKQYKNPDSPRGPISIDPETRDIVQNQYIREVRRVDGQLANIEIETIPNVKDGWKALNARK